MSLSNFSLGENNILNIWDLDRNVQVSSVSFPDPKTVVSEVAFPISTKGLLAVRTSKSLLLYNYMKRRYDLGFDCGINTFILDREKRLLMTCDLVGCRRTFDTARNTLRQKSSMDYLRIKDAKPFAVGKSIYHITVPDQDQDQDQNQNQNRTKHYLLQNPELDIDQWNEYVRQKDSIIFSQEEYFIKIFQKYLQTSVVFESSHGISSFNITKEKDSFQVFIGTSNGECYKIRLESTGKNQLTTQNHYAEDYSESMTFDWLHERTNREPLLNNSSRRKIKNIDRFYDEEAYEVTRSNNTVPERKPPDAIINDYISFYSDIHEKNVELVVLNILNNDKTNREKTFCVYSKLEGQRDFENYTDFSFQIRNKLLSNDFFQIRQRRPPRGSENDSIRIRDETFYLVGGRGIVLLSIEVGGGIHQKQFRKIMNPHFVTYSDRKKLFLIPINQTIEIWDSELDFPVYNLTLKSPVSLTLLHETAQASTFVVYDNDAYHELDLDQFQIVFSRQLEGKDDGLVLPVNLDLLSPECVYNTSFFKEDITGLSFICKGEILDLLEFPFDTLPRCLPGHNNWDHIMEFAQYYFRKLEATGFVDRVYGPLSPLILSIYHNDTDLLQSLLDKYRYPKQVEGYWSPLSFAFYRNSDMAVRVLCDHLIRADYEFSLSKVDFDFLLASGVPYCHELVSRIPRKMDQKAFPSHVLTSKSRKMYLEQNVSAAILKIKEKRYQTLQKHQENNRVLKTKGKKLKELPKEKVVDAFHFDMEYCYDTGSWDSLRLLDEYSRSESEEMVTGVWRELVASKWDHFYWVNVLHFCLYYVFTGIVTLLMIFLPESRVLLVVYYVFNSLYIVFEVVQVVAYCVYKFRR